MKHRPLDRRQFLQTSALLAGSTLLSPWAISNTRAADNPPPKPTATDQVTLGKTGIKLSRLGMGAGTNGGREQSALGKEAFIKLIRYGYDHGLTYIDAARMYATFDWIGDAIKGLPREKLFLQSKIIHQPGNVLSEIDRQRKACNTDYIDSLLIHCTTEGRWTDDWKRAMDGYSEAKEKKWIRAKGVSCHSLPALRAAVASDWVEVLLVRVNPQGACIDGETPEWNSATRHDIAPVMQQIKTAHAKGCGVIGMKLIGNGEFTDPADREKSIRHAMACKDIDAVVIGFKNTQQIDEAIERINRALAEA